MGLTSVWKNELNSEMHIDAVDEDGTISGTYHSLVGKDPRIEKLTGRTHAPREGEKQMLSFSVCYEIADPESGSGHFSTCAWSGWLKPGNPDTIQTFWILTSSKLDTKDEWSSHLMGTNVFERQ